MPGNSTTTNQNQLQQAWGLWLTGLASWDWYATMTFKPFERHTDGRLWNKPGWHYTDNRWRQWIEKTNELAGFGAGQTVKWVRCREFQKQTGISHFHALVAGVADQSRKDAWRRWFDRNGFARIEPYDATKGAGFYLCKYLTKDNGEVVFSDSMPTTRILSPITNR